MHLAVITGDQFYADFALKQAYYRKRGTDDLINQTQVNRMT